MSSSSMAARAKLTAYRLHGGRVLTITALGSNVAEARKRAYAAVDRIRWPVGSCRRDTRWRAMPAKPIVACEKRRVFMLSRRYVWMNLKGSHCICKKARSVGLISCKLIGAFGRDSVAPPPARMAGRPLPRLRHGDPRHRPGPSHPRARLPLRFIQTYRRDNI